jgi:hypothetical protein
VKLFLTFAAPSRDFAVKQTGKVKGTSFTGVEIADVQRQGVTLVGKLVRVTEGCSTYRPKIAGDKSLSPTTVCRLSSVKVI